MQPSVWQVRNCHMSSERKHNRPVILLVGKRKYVRTEQNPKNIRMLYMTLRQLFPPQNWMWNQSEWKLLRYFSKGQKHRSQWVLCYLIQEHKLFEFIKSQSSSNFGQPGYVQLPTDRGISQRCLNFKAPVEHCHFTDLSGIVFSRLKYFSP